MRLPITLLALALAAWPATPANAQSDPFNAVTELVSWFDSLNKTWDKIVTREERAQYLRSLDRLRIELANLAASSEILLAEIPDPPPDPEERAQLRAHMKDVRRDLESTTASFEVVAAQPSFAVPELISRRGRVGASRGLSLRVLDRQLDRTLEMRLYEGAPWNAAEIRTKFDRGLEEISRAQRLVTQLRNRIAAQR